MEQAGEEEEGLCLCWYLCCEGSTFVGLVMFLDEIGVDELVI